MVKMVDVFVPQERAPKLLFHDVAMFIFPDARCDLDEPIHLSIAARLLTAGAYGFGIMDSTLAQRLADTESSGDIISHVMTAGTALSRIIPRFACCTTMAPHGTPTDPTWFAWE